MPAKPTRIITVKPGDPEPKRMSGEVRTADLYTPWPKQELFHTNPAKNRLMVGSFGSGKSRPLYWEAVFHCLQYPGSESIILRTTFPDLKRTVINKFKSDVPPELYDYYHETDHVVFFRPVPRADIEGNVIMGPDGKPLTVRSKLSFGACETEEDTLKYLSTEWVYVGLEEAGEFPFIVFSAMASRNRCTVPGSRSCMALATNPGMGPGWQWIYKLFIKKQPFEGMDPKKYDKRQFWFIHSTIEDNPILFADKEYVRTLEADPLARIKRWGDINFVSGLYFDNWVEKWVVKAEGAFKFTDEWQETWVGYDYGFGHYCVITFHTKALYYDKILRKARIVNVTRREVVLQEATPKEQVEALVAAIPRGPNGEFLWNISQIYLSWERFMRTTSEYTTAAEIGDYLTAAGLPRPVESPRKRETGWIFMYGLLDRREWMILEECINVAAAIPMLPRDPKHLEDVLKPKGKNLFDDCGDSCRYGMTGMLDDAGEPPEEVKLERELASIKDPFQRHMKGFRRWAENQKDSRPVQQKSEPTWKKQLHD